MSGSNKERVVQGSGTRNLKKHTTIEDIRQNREKTTLSIRKEKTFQNVMKKRNLDTGRTMSPDNRNQNMGQDYFDSNDPNQREKSGLGMDFPTVTYRQTSAFGTSYMSPSTESSTGYTTHTVPIGNQQTQFSFQELCNRLAESDQRPFLDETKPNVHFLPYYAQVIRNFNNPKEQFSACICIRRLLSRETGPPIDAVVQSGVIPVLVQLLKQRNIRLRVEAAWALTNIASGTSDHVGAVINAEDAVPTLISLLSVENQELQDQCIWALGNITGDSPECRDFVLQRNILPPLLQIMANLLAGKVQLVAPSLMSNATWALSNLCRGRPRPDFRLLAPSLPVLFELIRTAHTREKEILVDACWAVAYLADGDDIAIQKVLDSGVAPLLLQLLDIKYGYSVMAPVLRGLGNIITGTFQQTQAILDLGILAPLTQLLSCPRKTIVKECCWVISNVTAGHVSQAAAVLNEPGLFAKLINILSSADFESKKECVWAIHHAVGWRDPKIVRYVVQCQVIPPLVGLLDINDIETICVVLDTIELILEVGEQNVDKTLEFRDYVEDFEDAGLLDTLDKLVEHKNESVYEKVNSLLETYFGEPEDDFDPSQNTFSWQPPAQNTGNYNF